MHALRHLRSRQKDMSRRGKYDLFAYSYRIRWTLFYLFITFSSCFALLLLQLMLPVIFCTERSEFEPARDSHTRGKERKRGRGGGRGGARCRNVYQVTFEDRPNRLDLFNAWIFLTSWPFVAIRWTRKMRTIMSPYRLQMCVVTLCDQKSVRVPTIVKANGEFHWMWERM